VYSASSVKSPVTAGALRNTKKREQE